MDNNNNNINNSSTILATIQAAEREVGVYLDEVMGVHVALLYQFLLEPNSGKHDQ